MAPSEHYRKAPIAEAIVDLRVEPRGDIKPEDMDFHAMVAADYPDKGKVAAFSRPTISGPLDTHESGFRGKDEALKFKSEDGKRIIQSMKSGYTFNLMAPYGSWEEMTGWAKDGWDAYVRAAKPDKVTRVATRYVNLINIPATNFYWDDYFNFLQVFPREFLGSVTEYFNRVSFKYPGADTEATVTMGYSAPSSKGSTQIILDIDVFNQVSLSPVTKDVWTQLEKLREVKNNIFDKMITDKTKELFR